MIFKRTERNPGKDQESFIEFLADDAQLDHWLTESHSHRLKFSGRKVLLYGDERATPVMEEIRRQQPAELSRLAGRDASAGSQIVADDWLSPPAGPWDFILIPIGLEQRADAAQVLEKAHARLTGDGVLIFSYLHSARHGVLISREETDTGVRSIPTAEYLYHHLLRQFSYKRFDFPRRIKRGRADIYRVYLRCQRRRPGLILIWGRDYTGKTDIARELEGLGIPVTPGDRLLYEILDRSEQPESLSWIPALQTGKERIRVTELYNAISNDHRKADSLFRELLAWLPQESRLQCLDLLLKDQQLAQRFYRIATRAGFYVWLMQRGDQLNAALPAPLARPDGIAASA